MPGWPSSLVRGVSAGGWSVLRKREEAGRGVRIGRGYFFHIRSHAKLSCSHGEWLDLKET